MVTMMQEIEFAKVPPIGRGSVRKMIKMLMVKEIQFVDFSLTHGRRLSVDDDERNSVFLGLSHPLEEGR